MQKILNITMAATVMLLLVACGSSTKEKAEIGDLKAKLEKLKKEKSGLDLQIRQVEEQLAKADPSSVQVQKLVSVDTIRSQDFTHFIELQGKIDADNVAYVSPAGMGGVIKAVYVKAGSRVSKGQTLLKLDDALARQGVVAAQQQAGVLKARLSQAQTIYERYQNLWKQNIGTELNVINAKAEADALQSQLNAAEAQVRSAQEQLSQTNVTAQISGVVDEVNVKVGEFFSPQTAADPRVGQIKIVNNGSIKMVTDVPENYASRIKKGDVVEVVVPESGKPAYKSTINVVGAAVNPTTRSFTVEAKLPADPILKPNQLATMKIRDYEAKAAVTVPVNVVQSDEKGKYVYVAEKSGNKVVARKKVVIVGEAYNGLMEIKSGLAGGDIIITEGYQTVYDGQAVNAQ
ncbi:efflux RND transporter periplasmic adaptor subunit [Terrimonas alba]|uniref:efflux RND transporter periplasmic adaptor subunit n=1 Tax=Terrimonas alba TaxID=3349636 RepID=UPI0035F2C8C3